LIESEEKILGTTFYMIMRNLKIKKEFEICGWMEFLKQFEEKFG